MAAPLLRPFRGDDLTGLVSRDGGQVSVRTVLEQAALGPAFTGVLNGRPIGCAGMVRPWPGVGMVWMIVSDEIGAHGLWLTRTVKLFIRDMIRVYALHRVEAVALEESVQNRAWLESLGFSMERDATARKFLQDQRSVIRYEMVKEG
jgi:RimJ/RimL family protein N-acetyltransferase